MKIEIKEITREHQADINIPNEPFTLFGRMLPTYMNKTWSYTVEYDAHVTEMCFPDENYDFEKMAKNSVFLGAYEGDTCVGLAIMQENMFRHLYLYDLKVNTAYRRQGIAERLIERAMRLAEEKGYIGVYTIGQDNNLGACLFYLHCGFEIGGFDTRVYEGTAQEDKSDIYFYKKL